PASGRDPASSRLASRTVIPTSAARRAASCAAGAAMKWLRPSRRTKRVLLLRLRPRLLPLRHLAAGAAGLGQADRDRLLAALHRLAGAAALQRPLLPLVHRLLHFLR